MTKANEDKKVLTGAQVLAGVKEVDRAESAALLEKLLRNTIVVTKQRKEALAVLEAELDQIAEIQKQAVKLYDAGKFTYEANNELTLSLDKVGKPIQKQVVPGLGAKLDKIMFDKFMAAVE